MDETLPPTCRAHAYPEAPPSMRHGFYRGQLSATERALLQALGADQESAAAEIAVLRLRIRGVLAYLAREEVAVAERLAAYRLLLRAVRTIARLLKAG